MTDRLDRLYDIVDGYNARFPEGSSPFVIVTRLLEEAGEVANAVIHQERLGAKVAKHGEPDPAALAYEIEDLLHTVLGLARHYGIEPAVDEAIDRTHAQLVDAGHITRPGPGGQALGSARSS